MFFSFDSFGKAERPTAYIANPDKTILGILETNDFTIDSCFSNISEASFKIYKYKNNKEVKNYSNVEQLRLMLFQTIGWFVIDSVETIGDAINEYKEVSCKSLEYELTTKTLTSFGSLGTDNDEQGGLDRYALYDLTDSTHSILHVVMNKAPNWTVGTIDPAISTGRRSFNNDSVDAYSFLTNDVANEFECVFQFNTFDRTISAYKLDNVGNATSIYLSYDNLVKEVKISSNSSDIKTVMSVSGGDDNGTPLQISDINPSGGPEICDFSYYKSWMSEGLRNKLEAYETEYNSIQSEYNAAITTLNTLYTQLSDIKNRLPDTEHSENWSLYGVDALQDEFDYYNTAYATAMNSNDKENMSIYWQKLYGPNGVNEALTTRKAEYDKKEEEIQAQEGVISSFTLNLKSFLGSDLYKELCNYEHDTDFVDDSFVVYDTMTNEEILQMKLDLLALARSELAKVCKPSYTMTVNAINFVNISEFRKFANQLELGCIITVVFHDIPVESRLLKIHYNWDNESDFELTFSSKSKLEEGKYALDELGYIAQSASTSMTINGTGWNNAKSQTSIVSSYLKNALDASKQKLINSSNETFIADNTGTKWRKWDNALDNYSPNQMWGTGNGLFLTKDNWQNVITAIGEIQLDDNTTLYGIAAELLLGKFIIGENLYMQNSGNTMTFNENGLSLTNGTNTIAMNPNETNLFVIKKGDIQQMYIDADGNTCFTGKITGGRIDIGKSFSVDENGNMTATNGTFTGSLTGNINNKGGTIEGGSIKGSVIQSFGDLEGDYTTIDGGNITTHGTGNYFTNEGTINGANIDVTIMNGTILMKGTNAYIRGMTPEGVGYYNIVGLSSLGNIVLGHNPDSLGYFGSKDINKSGVLTSPDVNVYGSTIHLRGTTKITDKYSLTVGGTLTVEGTLKVGDVSIVDNINVMQKNIDTMKTDIKLLMQQISALSSK